MDFSQFCSNFLATLIAGTILGGVATVLISKWLKQEDKKSNSQEQELGKAQKCLLYLQTIKEEVTSIIVAFEVNKQKYNKLEFTTSYIHFEVSYWDVLKTSGDLPSLFNPFTLQLFTHFYSTIETCNLLYSQLLASENGNVTYTQAFLKEELRKKLLEASSIIEVFKIELIIDEEIKSTERVITL